MTVCPFFGNVTPTTQNTESMNQIKETCVLAYPDAHRVSEYMLLTIVTL